MVEIAMPADLSREGLVRRLFAAFAMQVKDIEARIAGEGGEIVEDTKILTGLARTLETLISLDSKVAGDGAGDGPDIYGMRAELAARLARLNAAAAPKAKAKARRGSKAPARGAPKGAE
ncbi:hypothetical protein [Acuticoccus kandeliae]|uniref:hypothetical protein n=1 Tax=Acuticoccus kandeliae TaxID=2073160 RepID=UPI000D3E5E6E|nr:hypothetical protein [Acuticoccus kandeliae]